MLELLELIELIELFEILELLVFVTNNTKIVYVVLNNHQEM